MPNTKVGAGLSRFGVVQETGSLTAFGTHLLLGGWHAYEILFESELM